LTKTITLCKDSNLSRVGAQVSIQETQKTVHQRFLLHFI